MKVRAMVMCVLFVVVASKAPARAQDTLIMPLDQVRPGMKGVGETVFRGTKRDRFTFTVLSIVPNFNGWPKVIVVEITDCPECTDGKHMLEHHMIYGGMSGSPMYVIDPVSGAERLIGGLAMAKEFATTNKALVTPWQYQEAMGSKLKHQSISTRSSAEPGDYTSVCLVYGASDECFDSTITGRKDGRLYLTAHDLDLSSDEVFPYGECALPVFRSSVAELLDSNSHATKLTGERLAPIGSTAVHGKFGFVVNEGELPVPVSVVLTVNGVFDSPIVLRYYTANHRSAPRVLFMKLLIALQQLPVSPPASRLHVTIRLGYPQGVIEYTDTYDTAVASLRYILEKLINEEAKKLVIEGGGSHLRTF